MAVQGMGVGETALGRVNRPAFRHDLGASGMEVTARGRVGRGRQVPLKLEILCVMNNNDGDVPISSRIYSLAFISIVHTRRVSRSTPRYSPDRRAQPKLDGQHLLWQTRPSPPS